MDETGSMRVHKIILSGRKNLAINGVCDVIAFEECF